MSATVSLWASTIAGKPAVGAEAQRGRTTTMRDVEAFTEMTGKSTCGSGATERNMNATAPARMIDRLSSVVATGR